MQVTVEVELEQGGRVVGRRPVSAHWALAKPSACRSRLATKASRKRTGFSAAT